MVRGNQDRSWGLCNLGLASSSVKFIQLMQRCCYNALRETGHAHKLQAVPATQSQFALLDVVSVPYSMGHMFCTALGEAFELHGPEFTQPQDAQIISLRLFSTCQRIQRWLLPKERLTQAMHGCVFQPVAGPSP